MTILDRILNIFFFNRYLAPEVAPSGIRYKYSASDRSLLFTWDELPFDVRNGEITGYRAAFEGGMSVNVTREVKETKASYQGISATTKYRFKVSAKTGVNNYGPWSKWIMVEPNSIPYMEFKSNLFYCLETDF
uniref:Fibronectin type-III domain-containing protein n=1 Tax=Romanomermis culicivorax TaxID=13658 RepID=A0A915JTK0_ROMCU